MVNPSVASVGRLGGALVRIGDGLQRLDLRRLRRPVSRVELLLCCIHKLAAL